MDGRKDTIALDAAFPFRIDEVRLRVDDGTGDFFHWHEYFEVLLILSGTGCYYVNGQAFEVTGGDILIFNNAELHGWQVTQSEMRVLAMVFAPRLVAGYGDFSDLAYLKPFIERGCHVAFGGALTFNKSDDIREAAAHAPLDRVLVETDSPYMAPVPLRGTTCLPDFTVFTADKLADPEFLKELILAVAKGFDASGAKDLEIVLPESMKGSLESWASSELTSKLKAGVSASFSKKVAGGFTVAPRDGGWYVSFTDDSFDALIREYLRPVTRKLIFGK